MPKVHVNKKFFYKSLGVPEAEFSLKKLEDLCFDFGIEFEEEAENPEEIIFEVPANRYDLVCAEGIASALGAFIGSKKPPVYKIKNGATTHTMKVTKSTQEIRPFVVAAILRDITFDEDRYQSFIDLQDKLHQNVCRKRTLVAIGTHDLDTIEGPFLYDARKPEDIKFIPLNQKEAMDGKTLMEFYEKDQKLKHYLHIIRDSPVYPVIYDAKGVVLSLPPIINGDHSKIKLTTKNVFVECTATDYTKALVTLNTVVSMFSEYCTEPFHVEPVEIHYENDGAKKVTPELEGHEIEVDVDYVNTLAGIKLDVDEITKLLLKMNLYSNKVNDKTFKVHVPVTRSDILHPCDIAEDLAIAYGYMNVKDILPPAQTFGVQQPLNKFSDLMRGELVAAGYKECLNFSLCSRDEISVLLNRPMDPKAIHISNPKTHDFQVGRTTLIPGLLKTITSNKSNKLPFQIFEVGDVVLKADNEVGAKNERRLAALYTNSETSGFEFIHGLLDLLMLKLGVKPVTDSPDETKKVTEAEGYRILESEDPAFFEGMQAVILCKKKAVGIMGVIHPKVLKLHDWINPVSLIELNLELIAELTVLA